MPVDNTLAQCLRTGTLGADFESFMQTCVRDSPNINNVINKNDLKGMFDSEKAKIDDLLLSLNAIKDRKLNNGWDTGVLGQITETDKQIANVNQQIQENYDKADAENQKFLEKITSAPKETSRFGNLQDFTLGVFFSSLIIFTIIVTIIQLYRVDGSKKKAAFTFLAMSLAILIIYALLQEVA